MPDGVLGAECMRVSIISCSGRPKMMKPLSERSRDALEEGIRHIEKLEAHVSRNSREVPGPGWGVVIDMLNRDRTELEEELLKRSE